MSRTFADGMRLKANGQGVALGWLVEGPFRAWT